LRIVIRYSRVAVSIWFTLTRAVSALIPFGASFFLNKRSSCRRRIIQPCPSPASCEPAVQAFAALRGTSTSGRNIDCHSMRILQMYNARCSDSRRTLLPYPDSDLFENIAHRQHLLRQLSDGGLFMLSMREIALRIAFGYSYRTEKVLASC
jgi:hypothetical protein